MGLRIDDEQALKGQLQGVSVSDGRFVARLALGVRNKPRSGRTTWAVVTVKQGGGQLEEIRTLRSDELPEDALEVVLAIAATSDTWASVRDEQALLDAVEAQRFFVTGETPFFIRHLPSILEVLTALR